jgi:phage shock protein C
MSEPYMQKRLVRAQKERKIAGVCAGLGQYLTVDPVLIRIIIIALALMGGSGILIYLIAWIVMPLEETT